IFSVLLSIFFAVECFFFVSSLIIWDVDNKIKITTLDGHSLYVVACDWSPDGSMIASGEVDGTVIVWDASTGSIIEKLEEHRTAVHALTFTPNGQKLASGSSDRSIIIWDRSSGFFKPERTLRGHDSEVRALAFSNDGRFMASGSSDKNIYVWTTANYNIEGEGRTNSEIDGVVWYPSNDEFLTADGTGAIIRWQVKELEAMLAPFSNLLQEIEGDKDGIRREELIQKFNDLTSQHDPETLKDKRLFYVQWQCKRALGLLKGTVRKS
ncbi:MAG: WD40 repeat domain-containing protein, partial [Candidatus Hodarchaeota archaeon]